jgi:DNA-directed RNA polymerase specialized sigma24 family protein
MTPTQLDALLGLLNPRAGKTPEVLRMHHLEGISPPEIAQRLGMSRTGVHSALESARRIIALAQALTLDTP